MKIIIPLHFVSLKKDSKRYCDTTMPESIRTKDESKRDSAFAFIFGHTVQAYRELHSVKLASQCDSHFFTVFTKQCSHKETMPANKSFKRR